MAAQRLVVAIATLGLLAVPVLMGAGSATAIVAGAGFTTNNPAEDGNDTCLNSNRDPDPAVNCNLYTSKDYVWINGGPSAGQNTLTDGTYFFAVLEPGGQGSNENPNDGTSHNLSDTSTAGGLPTDNCPPGEHDAADLTTGCGDTYLDRSFLVEDGKISQNLGTHDDSDAYDSTLGLMIRASYYDDTSNPGGVYIMALCQYTPDDPNTTEVDESTYPVDASDCKYDAFKAPLAGCVEDCGPDQFGLVSGGKYYDTNRNGRWDEGEEGIDGWPIDFVDEIDGTVWTADGGLFSESFSADAYVFTERQPDSPSSWEQTGPSALESDPLVTGTGASAARNGFSYNVTVADNSTISGLYFGNVCEVTNTGGLTLGFWSNQNGRAILEAHDPAWRTLLNNLNLYRPTAGGSDFVIPTTGAFATFGTGKNKNVLTGGAYKVFRDWLLGADASVTSNMAYMLSAQMAATVLDYTYASLDEDSLVQDPGGNWVTISQLEAAANTLLGNLLDSVTTNNPTRSQLEAYKNIFDDLNNNRATVTPPDQDACTDPVFTALD